MEITGFVVNVKDNIAFIKTKKPGECAYCSSAGLCHQQNLEIQANNKVDAKIGDEVTVDVSDDTKSYLLIAYIFLIPVIIFFLGIYLYNIYSLLALFCLPLCILYFFCLKILNAKYKIGSNIISIVDKTQSQ